MHILRIMWSYLPDAVQRFVSMLIKGGQLTKMDQCAWRGVSRGFHVGQLRTENSVDFWSKLHLFFGRRSRSIIRCECRSAYFNQLADAPMIIARCFSTLIALLLACSQSSATNYRTEDRYNPQHIDSLPLQVRDSIFRRCAGPKALHTFARYFDGSKQIILHFEHFICDGTAPFAVPRGACIRSGFPQAGTIA